jgi:hypothetical protein
VLGIETSCDDTGVAVVRSDGAVLGEALASQHQIHEEWGGVVPGLARDAHAAVIDAMVAEALAKAGMASVAEVDAVGVTVGPGLEICLRVGCETGKALAAAHGKPFVGVHHLEAHCLMARMGAPLVPDPAPAPASPAQEGESESQQPPLVDFPFLALLVSGGHCMILECRGVGRYRILGGTLDDALGEAYDKAARLLRIGTGAAGGPAMEVCVGGSTWRRDGLVGWLVGFGWLVGAVQCACGCSSVVPRINHQAATKSLLTYTAIPPLPLRTPLPSLPNQTPNQPSTRHAPLPGPGPRGGSTGGAVARADEAEEGPQLLLRRPEERLPHGGCAAEGGAVPPRGGGAGGGG